MEGKMLIKKKGIICGVKVEDDLHDVDGRLFVLIMIRCEKQEENIIFPNYSYVFNMINKEVLCWFKDGKFVYWEVIK